MLLDKSRGDVKDKVQMLVFSFRHCLPERSVDPRLVAPSLLFEPGQNVGVQTQRDRNLERPVVPPPLRSRLQRKFLSVRRSLQPSNLSPFFRVFTRRFSFLHTVTIYLYVQNRNHKTFHVKHCTYNSCTYTIKHARSSMILQARIPQLTIRQEAGYREQS